MGPLPLWHVRRAAGRRRPPNRDADDGDDNDEDDSNDGDDDSRHHREGRCDNSRQREWHQPPPSLRRSPPMHEQRPQSIPPSAEYNPKRWLNDKDFCIQVGCSMSQSLTILGLGFGASEAEIKVHYRQLVREYHPDKNDPAITGLNASEASTFFQLLNNAHEYLKERDLKISSNPVGW